MPVNPMFVEYRVPPSPRSVNTWHRSALRNQRGPTWAPQHIRSPGTTAETYSTWCIAFGGRSFTCMSTGVPSSNVVLTDTVNGFHSGYESKSRRIDQTRSCGASISISELIRRGSRGTNPNVVNCPTMKVALVAIAGAAGALARYGIGVAVGVRSFPWATLGINLTGSFVLGLILTIGTQRGWAETTTVPIAVGFLGAYTTFSTFSFETYTLLRTDRTAVAVAYVGVSVVGGIAAAALGYAAARAVA
jgi:CrcB protein